MVDITKIASQLESKMQGLANQIQPALDQLQTEMTERKLATITTQLGVAQAQLLPVMQTAVTNLAPLANQLPSTLTSLSSNLENIAKPLISELQSSAQILQPLTQQLDDIIPSMPASIDSFADATKAVTQLSNEIPQMATKLKPALDEASKIDLGAITGQAATASEGALNVVISSGAPEAMAAALKQLGGTTEEIGGVMKSVAGIVDEDFGFIDDVVQGAFDSTKELSQLKQALTGDFANQLQSTLGSIQKGMGGVLNNVLEDVSGNLKGAVSVIGKLEGVAVNVPKGTLTAVGALMSSPQSLINNTIGNFAGTIPNVASQLTGLNNVLADNLVGAAGQINSLRVIAGEVQGAATQLAGLEGVPLTAINSARKVLTSGGSGLVAAANLLKPFSSLPVDQITEKLKNVDLTVAGNVSSEVSNLAGGAVSAGEKGGGGASIKSTSVQGNKYPIVSTEEELLVDLKSLDREITECIVQWTETAKDQNITAKDLNDLVAQDGQTIPFHYLILRNGNLQRCRPVDEVGEALPNGHEQYAIQIAFVGGINANGVVEDYKKLLSKDSLTRAQMTTFDSFIRIIYESYPGIQVLGHNDIEIRNVAPGFDVGAYINNLYGKTVIAPNPADDGPLNRQQIIDYVVS